MKTFFLVFFLLIVGLMITGFGWYYKSEVKTVAETLTSPYKPAAVNFVSSPKPTPPSDWKSINISSELTVKIPPDWVFEKELAVIKLPLSNISIAISSNSGVLVPEVFNQDLFKKIYNLKAGDEFSATHLDEENRFRNIKSGKILTGQSYVVVASESENIQTEVVITKVRAFILKNNDLIIFDLLKSTDGGIEFLKKIVSFASLN